jgi:hypothetical protein
MDDLMAVGLIERVADLLKIGMMRSTGMEPSS